MSAFRIDRRLGGWFIEMLLMPPRKIKLLFKAVQILLEWGRLIAQLESTGITLPAIDSLISATALTHKLTLVTRNVDDFNGTGVEITNPWA